MANAKRRSSERNKVLRRCPHTAKALTKREQVCFGKPDKGMVKDEKENPKLRLKNGAMADVRSAMYVLEELRVTLDVAPKEFQSLLALAHGRSEQADMYHVKALMERGWVSNDGCIQQYVADVILSSLEIRGDGPVLVNPFKLESKADKIIADRAQEDGDRQLLEFFGYKQKPPSRD